MSVANLTRYNFWMDKGCGCCEVEVKQDGEFVKFEEAVEASSNSLQQLKAEILPLLTDALDEFADRKFDRGEYYLKQAMAKLSAV